MNGEEYIADAVLQTAKLMIASAITAPKARGVNNLVVKLLSKREELEEIARKMEELAPVYGDFFARDANNVRNSDAVVLIGCKIAKFGVQQPKSWRLDADTALSLVNLGIALGSAVKTASILNIDNRIMFTIGVAAQELGLIDADFCFGIPLSVRPKNIYFDRVWPPKK